jgi:hypothetical protein
VDDPGSVEYWELDPSRIVDICICGHPVKRHELPEREYARCMSYPGVCYCSGGIRVAGAVEEDIEKPSGTQTNSRFFRRQWYSGCEPPLIGGVERSAENGIDFVWKISVCDLCGLDSDITNVGYISSQGRGYFSWTSRTSDDLIVAFCDSCLEDVEHESGPRRTETDDSE